MATYLFYHSLKGKEKFCMMTIGTTFMWLAFFMDQFRHLWCGQEASMGDYVVWVEDGLFWNVVFIVKFPWHTAKGNGFFVTVLAHHANMTILEYCNKKENNFNIVEKHVKTYLIQKTKSHTGRHTFCLETCLFWIFSPTTSPCHLGWGLWTTEKVKL